MSEPLYTHEEALARIDALEFKIGTAYQIVGTLLSGPDGKSQLFFSEEGQKVMDYLSDEDAPDPLPFTYPKYTDEELDIVLRGDKLSEAVSVDD